MTGAPRTAGWVGAVISMSGRVWSTVKVQSRLALHGTSGWSIANLRVWVPSSRCSGGVELAVADERVLDHVRAVVLERRGVHQRRQVGLDPEDQAVRGLRPEVGVLGRPRWC